MCRAASDDLDAALGLQMQSKRLDVFVVLLFTNKYSL